MSLQASALPDISPENAQPSLLELKLKAQKPSRLAGGIFSPPSWEACSTRPAN
jgi:hypothetical protein